MNKILAYLTNRGGLTKEDAQKLTHIHLAFGKLDIDGSIDVSELSILEETPKIRQWNPKIKLLLSLVTKHPDAFTRCAEDEELRKAVGISCSKILKEYHLDGIDFDWEYPCVPSNGMSSKKEDKENFTLLLQAVRDEMKQTDPTALLSIAAGADLYYVKSVELPKIANLLDYICLMTYDLKCGFHALSGHHTPLYSSTGDVFCNSCSQALQLFEQNGVPKEKLLMGAAFYSRQWENIADINHGFLQLSKTGGGYGPDFEVLQKDFIDKNGYTYFWDDEAKAPYLFNGSTFISYDNEQSLQEKCRYVNQKQYGGLFYWEHSCDRTGTLLNAIYHARNLT